MRRHPLLLSITLLTACPSEDDGADTDTDDPADTDTDSVDTDDTDVSDTDAPDTDTDRGDDTGGPTCATGPDPLLWIVQHGDEALDAGTGGFIVSDEGSSPGLVHEATAHGACLGIRRTDTDALWPGTGSFTVEGWVRADAGDGVIFRLYDCALGCGTGADANLGVQLDDEGRLLLSMRSDDRVIRALTAPTGVADDAWHHVAAVRETFGTTSTLALYVDGVEVATDPEGPVMSLTDGDGEAEPATVGCVLTSGAGGLQDHLSGVLDELSFHHAALTAAEVGALADAGAFGRCDHPVSTLQACGDDQDVTGVDVAAFPGATDTVSVGGQDLRDVYRVNIVAGADLTVTASGSGDLSMTLLDDDGVLDSSTDGTVSVEGSAHGGAHLVVVEPTTRGAGCIDYTIDYQVQ